MPRRSPLPGLAIAALGLAVLVSAGGVAGASSGSSTVNAQVGGALSITGADDTVSFGSVGSEVLPGQTSSKTGAFTFNVRSNKDPYKVTMAATNFVNSADSTLTFAPSALTVNSVTASTTAVDVITGGTKNNPNGTDYSLDASLTVPWVDPGAYTSTVTFTVVATP